MALLDRIANYFRDWDGTDEIAPKMELSINDLRYIADMNVERCGLIRQLHEAKLRAKIIRNEAITEFAERIATEISESMIWGMLVNRSDDSTFSETSGKIVDYVIATSEEIVEEMKGE